MKSQKEIEEMYDFIGFFNDGLFMNQGYRNGVMDSLAFVLYGKTRLDVLKEKMPQFRRNSKEGNK